MTGRVISSTWAGVSGSFYISNLESGVYEVIASSGIDQSIETVNISCMETQLTLQMGSSRSPNHTGGTVSVAALSVPSDARKAYERAVRLLQKNDMTGAWNQLNTALQMWPKYAEALTLRGALKLQRNGLQDAMRDFAAALESDRGYPLAYVGLAAGYNMTERFDDALRILDQAASLKIQSWQAHYETSKALLGKKMFDRALQEANQAGKVLGQDLPSINIVKARAYIGLKNTNSATAELQRLLQRKKTGPEAAESRALLASMGTSLPK
jgi:tetratricopeptide (TPR) repeat protein